jgi:hypothetical protein
MAAVTLGDGHARRDVRSAALTASMALLVVSLFLPWARSGEVERSSFDLAHSARRLDLGFPWEAPVAVVWFVLPLLAGLSIVLVALRRRRWGAIAGIVVGAVAAILAAAALWSSLDTSVGPLLALPVGLLAISASIWCWREPKDV